MALYSVLYVINCLVHTLSENAPYKPIRSVDNQSATGENNAQKPGSSKQSAQQIRPKQVTTLFDINFCVEKLTHWCVHACVCACMHACVYMCLYQPARLRVCVSACVLRRVRTCQETCPTAHRPTCPFVLCVICKKVKTAMPSELILVNKTGCVG